MAVIGTPWVAASFIAVQATVSDDGRKYDRDFQCLIVRLSDKNGTALRSHPTRT